MDNFCEKDLMLIIGSIIFLFISVIILLVIMLNRKKRLEVNRQVYLTEQRISRKIHDELANDIYSAMMNLELKKKENVLNDLHDIYNRVRNVSRDISSIPVGSDFSKSLMSLMSSYSTKSMKIIISKKQLENIDDLNEYQKITIYRAIQELLINAKKYSNASVIFIQFIKKRKEISILFEDNGVGFNKDKITYRGIANIERRIKLIGGEMNIDSNENEGVVTSIDIPLKFV